jgi:RNA polymerase sigma-70 factor (ECF subfamily)
MGPIAIDHPTRAGGPLGATVRLPRRRRSLGAALRRRETGALEAVYEEFGGTTFAYVRSVVRDRGAAEDVQQEVFTEVWRRAGEYDPARGGLLTWILTIARSRAIDYLRKRVPEPRDPGTVALEAGSEEGEGDRALERWRVAHLLRRLPDEEATMLRMRFYEDLSQTQISAALGVPLGTVKMRMVQGLRRLRDLLDEDDR